MNIICFRRLLTELDSYKPQEQKGKSPGKPAKGTGNDCVTYELYYRPEQAQFSKNARVSTNLNYV